MTRFVNYVTDVSINPTLQGARDDITSRKLQGLFLLPGVKHILLLTEEKRPFRTI